VDGCLHFCQNLEVSSTIVRGRRPRSIHGVYGGLLVDVLSGVSEYFSLRHISIFNKISDVLIVDAFKNVL